MPSCSGISIVLAAGFGCAADDLTVAAARRGFTAGWIALGSAGRTTLASAVREGFAAGDFAGTTLPAGALARGLAGEGLGAAARDGFDATYFT